MFISLQTSSIAASNSWKSSGNRFPIVPILKQSAFNTFPGYITSPAMTSKRKLSNNFNYFTTIDKQVWLHTSILIYLIGTDVSARGSLMWEEVRVPGENPHVQAGDRHTLTHTCTTLTHTCTTTVGHRDWTHVAGVRSECIVHCAS